MLKSTYKAMAILCLLVSAGCATTAPVFTDHDPAQDFSNYKSFAWISETPMIVSGEIGPSPLDERRIMNSIKAELTTKGYRFVADRSEADFAVAFTVGARDKMSVRTHEVVDFYGPHWRWGYDYYGFPTGFNQPRARTEVTVRKYTEGNLAIDVFDVARKSPVWHGAATKRLSRKELSGDNTASIKAAVAAILLGFPPQ